MWTKEDIPLIDKLFVRIHCANVDPQGKPRPAAFYNTPEHGSDLSSDWEKYTTPQESRALIGKQYRFGKTEFKNPLSFYIASFIVKAIYDLNCNQAVEHSPKYQDPEPEGDPNNRAHTSIIGEKSSEEVRLKMVDIANWEIRP